MSMSKFESKRNLGFGLIVSLGVAGVLGLASVARGSELQETGQYVNLAPEASCSKVGDVEGHVVCSFVAQGVLVAGDGELAARVTRGTIEYTNGVGKNQGHSVTTFGDGSTRTSTWEGETRRDAEGNRYSEGTYTCVGGSGRFKGIKCDGTWRSDYQKAKFSIGKYQGVATMAK
jgi:hypothetical protein